MNYIVTHFLMFVEIFIVIEFTSDNYSARSVSDLFKIDH